MMIEHRRHLRYYLLFKSLQVVVHAVTSEVEVEGGSWSKEVVVYVING